LAPADTGTDYRFFENRTALVLSGGWLLPPPRTLLDTSPLRGLLQQVIALERIPASIGAGPVRALAVAFFEATPEVRD
jgi:hypothetical protein